MLGWSGVFFVVFALLSSFVLFLLLSARWSLDGLLSVSFSFLVLF